MKYKAFLRHYFYGFSGSHEKRRNTEKIGFPIWHDPVTKDFFKRILQAVRHIKKEKQAGSEEIDKAKEKSRPVCVFVFHIQLSTTLFDFH